MEEICIKADTVTKKRREDGHILITDVKGKQVEKHETESRTIVADKIGNRILHYWILFICLT